MDALAYVLANPPGGGLEASRTFSGVLHTSRVPSTVALTTASSGVDDDVQLALITAPVIPGISAVLAAFVEGASCARRGLRVHPARRSRAPTPPHHVPLSPSPPRSRQALS